MTGARRCTSSPGTIRQTGSGKRWARWNRNLCYQQYMFGLTVDTQPAPPPSQTCWHYFHFTDHCVTSLCKHIKLCLYVTRAWCLATTGLMRPFFWVTVVYESVLWTDRDRALPWSFHCGAIRDLVQPWGGFWSSVSWSSGQPETESSSCGWRCLWSAAWKHGRSLLSDLRWLCGKEKLNCNTFTLETSSERWN